MPGWSLTFANGLGVSVSDLVIRSEMVEYLRMHPHMLHLACVHSHVPDLFAPLSFCLLHNISGRSQHVRSMERGRKAAYGKRGLPQNRLPLSLHLSGNPLSEGKPK